MKLSSLFGKPTGYEWKSISETKQLDNIISSSFIRPQIIFKHSTRCSISSMAKNRLEQGMNEIISKADIYYLDLLSYRNISNEIANRFKIEHESPQIIIIQNGQAIYDASHQMIKVEDMMSKLQ